MRINFIDIQNTRDVTVTAVVAKFFARIGLISSLFLMASQGIAGPGDRDRRDDGDRGQFGAQFQEGRDVQRRDGNGDTRGSERFNRTQQIAPQQQLPPQVTQDQGRHNGRMSAEDRRALRQQIDQAGHDIYPRGR